MSPKQAKGCGINTAWKRWNAVTKQWDYDWTVYRAQRKAAEYKAAVRRETNKAIKDGILVRPDWCSRCGATEPPSGRTKIEGHHLDYSKPLEVIWLCDDCHTAEHVKLHVKKVKPATRPTRTR